MGTKDAKDFIKKEGREVKERRVKLTLAGQFSRAVETCPEKGTREHHQLNTTDESCEILHSG